MVREMISEATAEKPPPASASASRLGPRICPVRHQSSQRPMLTPTPMISACIAKGDIRDHPTLPSRLIATSACASMANSIGSA